MTYQPFLIANQATGIDRSVQPWLIPNDALTDLLDGFVYRGVTNKRDGYSAFANGLRSSYTESRIVHNVPTFATGQTNTGVPLAPINLPNVPISRGSVTVTDGASSFTDNGIGGFSGAAGSINYTTGVITGFQFPAASGAAVTVNFNFFPGLPVMGVMNFVPRSGELEMLVADTKYVNRFDRLTDRLVDISPAFPAPPYTGTTQDFWSSVNYEDATSVPRLLFCNRSLTDVIQQWDGTTVTNYAPMITDKDGNPITINARQMFEFQDRLVLFQTVENGVLFPRRIRISGFGINTDNFTKSAPGAGFIDIPDNTFFYGASFNRDDMIFFTEAATWLLKYSGNDVKPFILKKLDASRGCKAAFSVFTYLNKTQAISPRGMIQVDGYAVDRMDDKIPTFSFNNINNQYFQSCFSGFIDEDRDVYLLYPSEGVIKPLLVPAEGSDRILVTNYEEDNFAIYRIPLSCMGNFESTESVIWADLTAANGFPNWQALSAVYASWNAFPYARNTPIGIGGGHKGEVWRLNDNEGEDNPLPIRNIVITSTNTVQVTTDWNNYNIGDYIYFDAILGMSQLNNKQGAIKSVDTPYNIFTVELAIQTTDFGAYTSGGIASKVIPFECTTKKLNPFVNQDSKLKIGWVYFYVTTSQTALTHIEKNSLGEDVIVQDTAFLDVDVIINDTEQNTIPSFSYKVDLSTTALNDQKKWVKIWINQTAKFIQFRFKNNQAGVRIQIHAVMPGMQQVGRLI